MPKKKKAVITEEDVDDYFKERSEWTKRNKKEVFKHKYEDIKEVEDIPIYHADTKDVEERNMTEDVNDKLSEAIGAIGKLSERLDLDKFSKSFAKNIAEAQKEVQKEYSNITETTGERKRNILKNKLSWGLVNLIRMEGK